MLGRHAQILAAATANRGQRVEINAIAELDGRVAVRCHQHSRRRRVFRRPQNLGDQRQRLADLRSRGRETLLTSGSSNASRIGTHHGRRSMS
jgi:hypothetical protein